MDMSFDIFIAKTRACVLGSLDHRDYNSVVEHLEFCVPELSHFLISRIALERGQVQSATLFFGTTI